MLEFYFVKPETLDRIRSSWVGSFIEEYVSWLNNRGYTARTVCRRVPILVKFGQYAREQGATTKDRLPEYVDGFVDHWVAHRLDSPQPRKQLAKEVRGPIEQLLRLVLPGFMGWGRPKAKNPFPDSAPGFFEHLRHERGLRESNIIHYKHYLRLFEAYLQRIGLDELSGLSPTVLSAFVAEVSQRFAWSGTRNLCGVLRVFLRYLYHWEQIPNDLSASVEAPREYRMSSIPRSIEWNDVKRLLETVDQRSPIGKRDYAILLLMVTYGLRAYEVASLKLEDINWKRERLRVPERKAGHSTAYPLSTVVGNAILQYLQHGRPVTTDRHVFFRAVAPLNPITPAAVSSRTSYYLKKAGISVTKGGSHTLRHTCVQRLLDAELSLKIIGDYVGHSSTASTEIYGKVAIEKLREVAMGPGEEVL